MWIKRTDYDDLMKRALEANGVAQALERQVAAQQNSLDWLMVRTTQLEHERAQLIYRYMDVKITVPELAPVQDPTGAEAVNDIPSFNDVGDEAAKRLKLDWDAEGRVTQDGKVIT